MTAVSGDSRWWLATGEEECLLCEERVQYHALYHCRRCDRPMCMTCSVTIIEERTVVCHDCLEEGES